MGRKLDESMDRVLRESLGSSTPAGVGECLDAETLAAWTDGGLSAAERATAERHLSACQRCQTMMAIVVQTSPSEVAPESWWQRMRAWPWLVPVTAGTAAVVLWVAVQNGPSPAPLQQPAAPATAPIEQPARPATAPIEAQQEQAAARSEPTPSAPEPKEGIAAGAREERANAADARRDLPSGGRDEIGATQAPPPEDRLGQLAETAAAPAAAPAAPGAAAPPAAAPQALESSAAKARSNEKAVPTFRRAEAAGNAIAVLSPDPAVRWVFGSSGTIQFSTTSGSTWETLASGVTTDLVAGASPSTTVCWVVGRAGTVLLTTDGRRFQRLPFPESVDLTAVRAMDARAAIVSTADMRNFRTSDGGQTWTRTPLQDF